VAAVTGIFLEKLLFQIWESFHLRKSVGCLSVHCMAWMYSSFEIFTCVKKASKLIISSNPPSSRNANKDLDFSKTTFSSTLTGSMILVALIGGTGKLYLQCEFFLFSTTSCLVMSMDFRKFWIQMIYVACYVFIHKLFDLGIVIRSIHWCILYPQQCVVMFISPILEFSDKKVVRYFSEKRFSMAYQLSQSIYSMSLVASTCHRVFSYESVNVAIF